MEQLQYHSSGSHPLLGSLTEASLGEREDLVGVERPVRLLEILVRPSPHSCLGQCSVTSQVTRGSLEGVVL